MSYDGGGWSESDEPVGQLNNATTMMSILGLALLAAFSRGLNAADGPRLPSAESPSANATTKYLPLLAQFRRVRLQLGQHFISSSSARFNDLTRQIWTCDMVQATSSGRARGSDK